MRGLSAGYSARADENYRAAGIKMKKHILIGAGAAILLLGVYFGIIVLAQGLDHALEQTAGLWYWIALFAAGVGVQAGLFSFFPAALRERRAAVTASVAASGGISAGSVGACSAPHLAPG